VASLSGDHRAARRLADIAAPFPRSATPLPAMDAFATEAVLALGGSGARAREIVADRIARGHVFSAAFLVMALSDAPIDGGLAHALRERTATCQSPLLRAIGDYACADAARDVDAVLQAADGFGAMGAEGFAVNARGHAAALHFDAGRKEAAFALAQEIWEGADQFGDGRVGILRPLSERIGLTEREVEAVLMAAGGDSNKDIADTLGLSQRTVENRWHLAYAKSGASDRAALIRACATWLRAVTAGE
jgi:DNA-binding CsgD family transcriptional regulator